MVASAKLQRVLMVALVVLVAAIVVVLTTGQGGGGSPTATASAEFEGPTMPPGLRAHDFTLRDQNGRPVSLAADRGHVVILTFIHSLCHDTCPFMVEQIKGALNLLRGNGAGVPAIGVSAYPSEDTTARRRAFLAKHEMTGRLAFVNGPEPVMRPIYKAYAIQPVTPKVDHSTFVILIDKRGLERVGFAADQLTPEALAHDIRALERESA
jgi:protein SCO1/2